MNGRRVALYRKKRVEGRAALALAKHEDLAHAGGVTPNAPPPSVLEAAPRHGGCAGCTSARSSGKDASWAVALVVLGVVTPVHARLLFGPSGRGEVVAEGPAAA